MAGAPLIGQFDPSQIKTPTQQRDPFMPREDLINAMVSQESSGKASALGKKGEVGLMQVRPETAQMYGVHPDQLRDPATNRRVGSQYFADMLKRYKGNEFLALVAYNSGPGRVDKGQLLPQSVKYATNILRKAGGGSKAGATPPPSASASPAMPSGSGMPSFVTQNQFNPSSNVEEIPSTWQRIKASLGSGLEGTAEAAEGPPTAGASPTGVAMLPPPSGARPLKFAPPSPGVQVPQPRMQPPPQGARPFDPSQFKTSVSISGSGPRLTLQQQTPTATERQQLDAANIAVSQLSDAANFYEQKIAPKESQFTGSATSASGWRGFMQGPEYTHSRYTSMLGLHGDPDIQDFYSKIGPLQAETLKGYIGGRIGIGMAQYLGPHIPNPQTDDLPTIRRKVADMRRNLPIVIQTLKGLSSRGANEDQIVQSVQALPWQSSEPTSSTPSATPTPFSSEEQQLLKDHGF